MFNQGSAAGAAQLSKQDTDAVQEQNPRAAGADQNRKLYKTFSVLFICPVEKRDSQYNEKVPEDRWQASAEKRVFRAAVKQMSHKPVEGEEGRKVHQSANGSVEAVRGHKAAEKPQPFKEQGKIDGRYDPQSVDKDGEEVGEQEA